MDNLKVNLNGNENSKEKNFKERIGFIKYWADFVKNNPDMLWSKGQAELINSQLDSSANFYKELEKTEEGKKILRKINNFKS